MNLIAVVKHFIRIKPARYNRYGEITLPEERMYDYDDEFIFTYDMKTLKLKGSGWSRACVPDDVAETIRNYFNGTNYVLADIVKQLD